MKLGTNTKAAYGFCIVAALFITYSGWRFGFGDGLIWAYVGVVAVFLAVTIYNLATGKK